MYFTQPNFKPLSVPSRHSLGHYGTMTSNAVDETLSNQLSDGTVAEIQKEIYSEGLAASEIKAANASKTLSNSALSTGSAFSRTSEGLRGLGFGN